MSTINLLTYKLAMMFPINLSIYKYALIIAAAIGINIQSYAQEGSGIKDSSTALVKYGTKGFQFQTLDNKFLLQIQSRLQFRFSTPQDQDPLTYDDFQEGKHTVFKINRARLKVGGHAFKPWLKYYWEYELSQSNLLDFRVMIEKWEALNFKVGQWKTEFTRERFISSGEQQMAERSIINRPFTLDRQDGATVYGRLKSKKTALADFNYWLAALTGNGRGATRNDDKNLMYFGRFQWNVFGRELEFEGCDLLYHKKPAAIIALAGVTNKSPYTRFSQSGGGSLEGFDTGDSIEYRVKQWQIETALMYKGFSWQEEFHHKYIINTRTGLMTTLRGVYLQAGYFFHYLWPAFPKKLEIAARFSTYRPDVNLPDNLQQELGMVANWFFSGHKNKLSAEFTHFYFQDEQLDQTAGGLRFRLQWDISF